MRASEVLQKCLSNSLSGMHALRERTLLHAVEALLHGRRLTLMDIARSWPGALRVRGAQPVIVIDWSDLKPDKSWCLLRAAVPVGGRTLTLLDMV
ncbi:IS4 family transposase, partial [Xanthomonas hortorum pv. vitians]|nr:IS4 family transposase [Xanthomonas hortorum pv. vitians]